MRLERALRNYRLDALLALIGERIRQQFHQRKPITEEELVQRQGALVRRGLFTITAWQLSDLAYLAIMHTHDFAQRTPTNREVLELMNLFHERDGRVGRECLDRLNADDKTLCFTVGFSQKQFWYQESLSIRAEFNRQVEMLEILSGEASFDPQLDRICQRATTFDLRTFRKLIFALYAVGGRTTDLTHFTFDGTAERLDRAITAANVYRVMDFYTANYREIRRSPLQENAFFSWPIIRTASNRRIALNEYFLARKIADGPYWILRNHFMSLPSRSDQETFVRFFGELFDLYFEELLDYYFPPNSFRRVQQVTGMRNADWILEYHDWTFVIELKSSLLPLAARKNYPEPEVIRAYLSKLADGVRQLDATAHIIGDHEGLMKILIHYEPLFVSDGVLRPLAVQQCSDELFSKDRVFFCDLEDMETLCQIMHDMPSVAEAVLREKMDLESREDGAALGKEFNQIIKRHVRPEVNRFIHRNIDHYHTYIFPDRERRS